LFDPSAFGRLCSLSAASAENIQWMAFPILCCADPVLSLFFLLVSLSLISLFAAQNIYVADRADAGMAGLVSAMPDVVDRFLIW